MTLNRVEDHPRSRGEYRWSIGERGNLEGSSPLSRGIPPVRRSCGILPRIIPALAGNTRCVPQPASQRTDHPRSRGEYEYDVRFPVAIRGSSPLSRGIRFPTGRPTAATRIIPALAGNTSRLAASASTMRDHPRSRGEYLPHSCIPPSGGGSSPLSRGILQRGPLRAFGDGIIPALAGNTKNSPTNFQINEDHPRSRGEYLSTRPV